MMLLLVISDPCCADEQMLSKCLLNEQMDAFPVLQSLINFFFFFFLALPFAKLTAASGKCPTTLPHLLKGKSWLQPG
jgi:hypothetical protein